MIRPVVLGSVAAAIAAAAVLSLHGVQAAAPATPAQPAQAVPTAPKAPPVDLVAGQKIATQVCAACHGADGNSPTPANPKLAAQHPEYLAKQLHDFRPRDGAQPLRPSPIMMPFAQQLSEQDILNVSAFYAAQPLKPAFAGNKELVELGQRIYRAGIPEKRVPACASCHGPSGSGMPAQYPRLHGQFAAYTEAQMVAFATGARPNNLPMQQIAERMSEREIRAVADYIAGLR
ncbi:MAG TPA: c-type cytochrome [Burkholderiaceae bacterium]|nr:c-type cytochrome [Burkholderiaceae bacterium]